MSQSSTVRVSPDRRSFGLRHLAVAAALVVAGAGVGRGQVPADAPVVERASGAAAAAAEVTTPVAYAWRGHEAEIEAFLRTAPIERWKDIPVGITKPRRAYFAPGGPAASMAWKPLPTGTLHGKMESYRSEIAAYLLNRHLGLDVVPPVVERRINGVKGAAVYWIDGVKAWDPSDPPKGVGANWSRQTSRMLMFDQLIANIDRNQGNLLYDAAGHLHLIDHSRAFTPQRHLSGLKAPRQFERALWERMATLTRADLEQVVGAWLSDLQIEALLARRDEMAKHLQRQVRERGEDVVFLPAAPEPPSDTRAGPSAAELVCHRFVIRLAHADPHRRTPVAFRRIISGLVING